MIDFYVTCLIFHNFSLRETTASSGTGPPPFRGFTITLTHTHSVGLLWTSDKPDAETSI